MPRICIKACNFKTIKQIETQLGILIVLIGLLRHNNVIMTPRILKIACFVNILFSSQEYFATSNFN